MKAHTAKALADNLLHVSMTATLIGALYLTYLPNLERRAQLRSADALVQHFGQDLDDIQPKTQRIRGLDASARATLRVPDMTAEDLAALNQNRQIRNATLGAILLLDIASIAAIMLLYRAHPFDLRRMAKHAGVVSLTAAGVYLLFSAIIIRDFHTVHPNIVKTTMLDTFQDFNKAG